MKQKHWYDFLWLWTVLYFSLGFFNILFAWLGLSDFMAPLFIALLGGGKAFCNRYCGRGQLFQQLGGCLKCSRNKPAPRFLSSKSPGEGTTPFLPSWSVSSKIFWH